MGRIELNKRRIFLVFGGIVTFFLLYNALTISDNVKSTLSNVPIPGHPSYPKHEPEFSDPDESWDIPNPTKEIPTETPSSPKSDLHPISRLMQQADETWRNYEDGRSMTFKQTVDRYRSKYGRHPPPGFKDWYKFARQKNVYMIDDFDQIMDDLRPFWAVEPAEIRSHAAHMWEDEGHGIAVLHLRKRKIVRVDFPQWRSEVMASVIEKFIEYLPDMDIPMNRLDQPRVVVPWEDMQEMLRTEYETRSIPPETVDSFTNGQPGLLDMNIKDHKLDESPRVDAKWFNAPGQQYMKIARKGCSPDSPARLNLSNEEADSKYKVAGAGFVSNFNLSSDLCTVGPTIQNMHGMLYSASSIIASHKLVPIFGECKVSVNNDILFPANMYYKHDNRYDYEPEGDLDWREKNETIIWRGVTSGGVQISDNWQRMHRQRLVQLFNGTWVWKEGREVNVLTQNRDLGPEENVTYNLYQNFQPSQFANQHADIGFVESWGCVPNCSFYDDVFSWKPQTTLSSQFKSKYLIDVDGHSFSGRWRAFLQSKSLGFKATIFREWHDSRLFAWRHFVPVDSRYDDLYALLTYFIGYGSPNAEHAMETEDLNPLVFVAPHQEQAQRIARQSREWANKVLRREDIEVYMFRLLLEYGRIIDDNRDRIGYSGDGSEMEKFDKNEEASSLFGISNWWKDDKKGDKTANSGT